MNSGSSQSPSWTQPKGFEYGADPFGTWKGFETASTFAALNLLKNCKEYSTKMSIQEQLSVVESMSEIKTTVFFFFKNYWQVTHAIIGLWTDNLTKGGSVIWTKAHWLKTTVTIYELHELSFPNKGKTNS